MFTYKDKKTKEIRENKNPGSKLWENINMLKGKETHKKEEIEIYREGKKLSPKETEEEITRYWKSIYNKNENRMQTVWNAEKKAEYEESHDV